MMITAEKLKNTMRGGAQSFLMLCDDGSPYVVKFQNNAQHLRVLANEWFATKLAQHLDLPVPPCEMIQVDSSLIEATPELRINRGDGIVERCVAGLQFGSRFVGGLFPGLVVDYLPTDYLLDVPNLNTFHGALVFDKWTGNTDGRQAVFCKKLGATKYTARFIDQGYCFNGGCWNFKIGPASGTFARNVVYKEVRGWSSFEPWLTRVEELSVATIWSLALTIPPEWYDHDISALEELARQLEKRRSEVREMIAVFRDSSRKPFPNWLASKY
jgi:hypothetical protein